jgi:death-on-curing protein
VTKNAGRCLWLWSGEAPLFVAIELFLVLNGSALQASGADCVLTMLTVASGEMDEAALADWVRCHTSAL